MLYQAYDIQQAMMAPIRFGASLGRLAIECLPPSWSDNALVRTQGAVCEMLMNARLIHTRPPFRIDHVMADGRPVPVREEAVAKTPFGTLIHFAKESGRDEPRVLIVSALAGHFSTLLRDTVRTMLADHDVYLADWNNARDIPVDAGPFDLGDYIGHVIWQLEELGPGTHVVAVCQPCPAVIAATAVLAERGSSATPRSLTLMAGPVDTSVNPTSVNDFATTTPLPFFEDNLVTTVPIGYKGCGRRVYPGFLQVSAFMSMNPTRHLGQQVALFKSLVEGDVKSAQSIRGFYDEYLAVLDLPAEFYLETIDAVFQRNLLARGTFMWRGQKVNPAAVSRTALLTIEGERDDICGLGQTLAAQELLSGIDVSKKRHYLQVGVGHYGVFSGRHWRAETYPVVREFILLNA